MKALTVQQPWAHSIVYGGKLIENRTATWKYRGQLLIHAGTRWSKRGAHDPRITALFPAEPVDGCDPDNAGNRPIVGAIIGVVDWVDLHPDAGCCRPWGESSYTEAGGTTRTIINHLVLENPRPLPVPVPCRGALGLWTPPAHVLADIHEQLAIG